MEELHIYAAITLAMMLYLHWHETGVPQTASTNTPLIVERLAADSIKKKNYRRPPENHTRFGCSVKASMIGKTATLEYEFPFIDARNRSFRTEMATPNFSAELNQFGTKTSCFGKRNKDSYELKSLDAAFLLREMNKGGFYFHGFHEDGWGVDYNQLLNISAELSEQVAGFIVKELQEIRRDSYENRVRAALNFVQYIPYGVPDFDAGDDAYFGIALPNESLAISYSDCDSKSTFLASILRHLIKHENIMLVSCEVDGGGHMVTGVSGLPFPGPSVTRDGKRFLLLETTTPIPIERQSAERFTNIKLLQVEKA